MNHTNSLSRLTPALCAEPRIVHCGCQRLHSRHRYSCGAAVTELLVTLGALLTVSMGILQGALIYNAKTTLNYAIFEAARAGAVNNAQRTYMTEALARGLMPLYGGGTDTASLNTSHVRAYADIMLPVVPTMNIGSGSRLEILSPTQEAFQDFGITINGQQQIPNEHLRFKDRGVGTNSGVSLQDANLLKLKITYGYKLYVPFINRLIAATLTMADPGNAAFYQADPPRLPIVAQATLRMQSNPFPDRNASSVGGGGTPPGSGGGGGGGSPPDNDDGDGGDGTDPCANGECGNGDPQACTANNPGAQSTQTASTAVGNPINVVTGNKYQRETDLTLPGVLAPEFTRHYNSRGIYRGPMGYGWTHTYSVSLNAIDDKRITIQQADGRTILFRQERGDVYQTRLLNDGYITQHKNVRVWHWRSGRALTFDENGKLMRIAAPSGEALALTYDRGGRLVQVSDSQDRRLAFNYYSNGRLEYVLDPAGNKYVYTYDHNGNLATVTAQGNPSRVYHYEDRLDIHNLTGITDGRGIRYATYAYDQQDRAILSTHADEAGKVALKFEKGQTTVINSLGKASIYRTSIKDNIPLVTAVEGPGCSTCGNGDVRYNYNARLQLTRITTHDDVTTSHEYDPQGRLARTSKISGGKTWLMARFDYDGDSIKPKRIIRPSIATGKDHVVEIAYNKASQVVSLRESGFAPDEKGGHLPISRTTALYYDAQYRLVMLDGPRNDVKDQTRFAYDARGRLNEVQNADGTTLLVKAYDDYGRPTELHRSNQIALHLSYDPQGRLLSANEGEERISFNYGPDGQLASTTNSDGSRNTLELDTARRTRSIVDADGNRIVNAYDREGHVLATMVQDASNTVLQAALFLRDHEGTLKGVATPEGLDTIYGHDAKGRLTLAADASGQGTFFARSGNGSLDAKISADNGVARYTTDERQGVAIVRDSAGRFTAVARDDFGRIVAVRSPDTGISRYQYDEAGNMIGKADASGVVANYSYDAMNRAVRRKDADAETRFIHHANGIEAIGTFGNERFGYDESGHLVEHARTVNGHHFVTRYRYDKKTGKLVEKVMPEGTVLAYKYSGPQGRLTDIKRKGLLFDDSIVEKISYRPFGPATAYTTGDGAEVKKSYDGAGRLVHINNSLFGARDYRYDRRGHLVEVKSAGESRKYTFDAVGRILQARGTGAEESFAYSRFGDRYRVSDSPAMRNVAFNSNPLSASKADRLAYDRVGRITAWGQNRFEYASSGRPVKLFVDGRLRAEYVYNPQGERIVKKLYTASGVENTLYLYNENRQLEAEADEKGRITTQYVYNIHTPVAMITKGEIYYLHGDHREAPEAVTNKLGKVVWAAVYQVFGKARVNADPDADGKVFVQNLRLPGQYYDTESNTHYNYYRNYDPELGRYLQADPMGISQGMNLYTYANSNPVQYIDPQGLFALYIHEGILKAAFARFDPNQTLFSQHTIDLFISWNKSTDLAHQFNYRNHFDNPNSGPPFDGPPGVGATQNYTDSYLFDSVVALDQRRAVYSRPPSFFNTNMTNVLDAFGQNSHAIADFYAHSNWVDSNAPQGDPNERGGCFTYQVSSTDNEGVTTWQEVQGWVPHGQAQTVVWNEDITAGELFSGTVRLFAGDLWNTTRKNTHGYWSKDTNTSYGGSRALNGNGMMTDEIDSRGNLTGDMVAVSTAHFMARELTIQHTLQEITRLFNAAPQSMRDLFAMTQAQKDAASIAY